MSTDTQQLTPSQKRVLVIGDHCIDAYYYGIVERLSPEAPVPVLKITHSKRRPGMCENVAENLRGLGCHVDVVTQQEEIVKHRYVEEKRFVHLLRVDDEEHIAPVCVADVCDKLNAYHYDAVVISDYEKGFIHTGHANSIVSMCKKHDVPVFVDTKKNDITCYEGCIIKVNYKEFRSIKKFPPEATYELIITIGEGGAEWNGKQYPAKKVKMYDVCGAGDVFIAALVFEYLETQSLDKAIKFANNVASKSVTHFGNYVIGECSQ